jgi:hypothetical protein
MGAAVERGTTAAAATTVHAATDLGAATAASAASAASSAAVVPLRVSAARQDERQGRCHCKFLHWLTSLILTGACRSFTCENANDRDALPEPIMFVSLSERIRPNTADAAASHAAYPVQRSGRSKNQKEPQQKPRPRTACATAEALGPIGRKRKHDQHEQTFSLRNVPAHEDGADANST